VIARTFAFRILHSAIRRRVEPFMKNEDGSFRLRLFQIEVILQHCLAFMPRDHSIDEQVGRARASGATALQQVAK
jgi:hypothetical protein